MPICADSFPPSFLPQLSTLKNCKQHPINTTTKDSVQPNTHIHVLALHRTKTYLHYMIFRKNRSEKNRQNEMSNEMEKN